MKDILWDPKIPLIIDLIKVLYTYKLSGGCCHIVTDDNNISNGDLDYVINYCKSDEAKEELDCGLSLLICSLLRELTYTQRVVTLVIVEQFEKCRTEEEFNFIIEQLIKKFGSINRLVNFY